MRALILNSGIGKRMGELTKTKNKCMAEIGPDTAIIDWQLSLLLQTEIRDVVMTTGPFAKDLIEYVSSRYKEFHFLFRQNPVYDQTNYIYSIEMAADVLEDDILMMHGDLIFEESVLHDVLKSENSAMVIDTTLPLPEKDFKAVVLGENIVKVGIEFFDQAYAAQPLYKLRKKDWLLWLERIHLFCDSGNRNVYAENALNEIAGQLDLRPLDVQGRICMEIDNSDDLARARLLFEKMN